MFKEEDIMNAIPIDELKKLALRAAVAAAVAVIEEVEKELPNLDFGMFSSVIKSIVTMMLTKVKEWLRTL